jgi:capsular polysaccharide biosynthesis protein
MENQEFVVNRNPIEYFKIFFRRKWLLITPIYAGLVLGIIAGFLLPPAYKSSTVILVEEEKIINPLIQNLAVSTTAAQRMQSIREILLGWSSLVELTKKLNLANNTQNQAQFEKLILALKENIDVKMKQPNLITISYFGKNPQQTQLVTITLTDILMERNMKAQTREIDVAINFIKEQLSIYKRKIKESEIAKMEEELKNLLIDSTEQHPMVRELRQKIAVAKQQLESGEYQVTASEQPITDSTRQALQKELDKLINKETKASLGSTAYASETEPDTNNSIYKLILMDKVSSSVARDMDVNANIYNMLLERLETAKITQRLEASKEGTRYSIIEPARLPLNPVKPDKLKLIIVGMIFGSFAGTGLVFGKELMENSFLDIEDAKQNLELPVLGAISRITTQEEIDKQKHKQKKWIIIALSASFILILLAMLISFLNR